MSEEDEFSPEFQENQRALMKQQQEFEIQEKERIEGKDSYDLIEEKKKKKISWAVIIAMGILILILGIILL